MDETEKAEMDKLYFAMLMTFLKVAAVAIAIVLGGLSIFISIDVFFGRTYMIALWLMALFFLVKYRPKLSS